MKRIAYQGVTGAYSNACALAHYGQDAQYSGKSSFRELFEDLTHGAIDIAFLPIENSLIGPIYETYDLLQEHGGHIVAEHYAKIEHCLLVTAGTRDSKQLRKVLSHPKALEQCRGFFARHPWLEPVVHIDTAAGAKEVSMQQDPTLAAIASRQAGLLYGLHTLVTGIGDHVDNYTRFVSIAQRGEHVADSNKCSLTFTLPHAPRTLLGAIEVLSNAGLNLSRIESRPILGLPFEYRFYVDGEHKSLDIATLVAKLAEVTTEVKLLGSYKAGQLWIA